jgi:hypothetical protein
MSYSGSSDARATWGQPFRINASGGRTTFCQHDTACRPPESKPRIPSDARVYWL